MPVNATEVGEGGAVVLSWDLGPRDWAAQLGGLSLISWSTLCSHSLCHELYLIVYRTSILRT